MRQRIGIAFASLAVAMFGVALIASLNDNGNEASDESSVIANDPSPTGLFDDLEIDEAPPAPSTEASPENATTSRRTTRRRSTTARQASAPAPVAEEEDDGGAPPPGFFESGCSGNGSD